MNLETAIKNLLLAASARDDIGFIGLLRAMIYLVYSPSLDPNKTWFALNDRLCVQPPRRFCENNIFELFLEETKSIKVCDLQEENGGPVSVKWFNNGAKASENVFVGSAFAVIAGNLRRKNPAEGEFLRSDIFKSLKVINKEDLRIHQEPEEMSFDGCDIESISGAPNDRLSSFLDSAADDSEIPSCSEFTELSPVREEGPPRETESPPKVEKSPPKCSTPISSPSTSPSTASNSCSFPEDSLSVSDISGSSTYAPATKKRKIRRKVETVRGSVDTVCANFGESLGDMIAQCCLFKRQNDFDLDGKKIISDVFVQVEKEHGVRKTFEELIPEELWEKRVEDMCAPDWMLLLCKLECKISDDGWQMLLNRTKLGKSGVSCVDFMQFHLIYFKI